MVLYMVRCSDILHGILQENGTAFMLLEEIYQFW